MPDEDFFDACAEGNTRYIRLIIESGEEFDWNRSFQFESMFEGSDFEVIISCSSSLMFLFLLTGRENLLDGSSSKWSC